MKTQQRSIVLSVALTLVAILSASTAAADEYRFTVHNNTDQAIKKVLVSEDGNEYGYFDIGKGIAPGAEVELVWDQSTNGESCSQHFKAVFASGHESDPVEFNFCEEGLTLEFE
ncbi:MAG: hypothetical protein ABI779_10010 [Acidobacteriota bacterium]